MDKLTLAGIVFGLVAIVGGSVLKGSGVAALANPAAFTIVIIGTFAAIFVQTPLPLFKHGMGMAKWVLKPPVGDAHSLIEQIVEWSNIARKQGLLGLESVVENQEDPFIKKGLQMLVDGAEPDTIRGVLEVEMDTKEHLDTQGAKMFESLGIYAPTLGIIGAVMGLMSVMKNLADPSKLGPGIAAGAWTRWPRRRTPRTAISAPSSRDRNLAAERHPHHLARRLDRPRCSTAHASPPVMADRRLLVPRRMDHRGSTWLRSKAGTARSLSRHAMRPTSRVFHLRLRRWT